MKKLENKEKSFPLSSLLVYLFVLGTFIFSYIFVIKALLLLKDIETTLRIIFITIVGFILFLYTLIDLIMIIKRKNIFVYVSAFVIMLVSSVCLIGGMTINKIYSMLDGISKDKLIYTTNLVVLKNTEFKNSNEFKVGVVNNDEDIEGNVLAFEAIDKYNLKVKIQRFDSVFELLENLYNKKLDGIFITSNYVSMYKDYDAYKNIENDVKVIYELSKEMKNQDYIESTGNVKEPFSVLLMGVDSPKNGLKNNAAFNGDTLMIITFNPHTLSATIFSIPRDTYVPIACLKGGSSKINSSAAYGTQCVIKTVENLTDIKMDYYIKINFRGVIDLVNSLGGIDITVPDKVNFCESNEYRSKKEENLICIKSGYQHMTGEQALAFARHRKTLPTGDFQRVQHQQLVVESIANSAKKINSMSEFKSVLNSIAINMDTNMLADEMLNFYSVGKNVLTNSNKDSMINIQKTYLTGYDLPMYVDNLRARVYTFQYYEQSLEEIKHAQKVNLELEQPKIVKTFDFSVNDKYVVPIIGKKYYSVVRNETIPDFTNKNIQYVKNWCEARKIEVFVRDITSSNPSYNAALLNGTVIKQNVKRGKLVKDISSITLDVIKHPVQTIETPKPPVVESTPVEKPQETENNDTESNQPETNEG